MKQALYSQLQKIKDSEIRSFVIQALNNAPEEFWHGACSTTGKFHPPENQGDAGIIRHILKGIITAEDLSRHFNLNAQDTDIVLASVILHDIQKCGIPWQKHTNYEHGKIASNWLRQFSLKEPEKTKIIEAVRYHMSRFTGTREDIPRACSPTQIELIVQLTDFFSSRKYASWLPNHNTSQEQIDNFLPGIIEQQSLNMQKEK